MGGDHAPNVIAGSYMFGAKKFDLETARKYMKQSGFGPEDKCDDRAQPGIENLKKDIAFDLTDTGGSFAIEMVTTDRSIGAFLSALPGSKGVDQDEIAKPFTRASNWKNTFNDATKTLGARDKNGKLIVGSFHEGTEQHYIWALAHDWTALIDRLGGKPAAITRLNTLFSIPASTPFTGAGTEPTGQDLNGGEQILYWQ
jgi:putative alpha-1,2-mannosidase